MSENEDGCPVSLHEVLSFGVPDMATEAGEASCEGVGANGIPLFDHLGVSDVARAIDLVYRHRDNGQLARDELSFILATETLFRMHERLSSK